LATAEATRSVTSSKARAAGADSVDARQPVSLGLASRLEQLLGRVEAGYGLNQRIETRGRRASGCCQPRELLIDAPRERGRTRGGDEEQRDETVAKGAPMHRVEVATPGTG
jgi:hypothetical protein